MKKYSKYDIMSYMGVEAFKNKAVEKPLTQKEATAKINSIAGDSRNVIVTNHAQERIVTRGYVFPEVLRILREGIVRREAEKRESDKGWTYKIEYIKFGEDGDAACVVAIKKNKIIIVTVI